MIRLIKNELFKIFHKKSVYVFGILILGFCLLNNILYKITYDEEGNYLQDFYIGYEEKDYTLLDSLDPNNPYEVDEYIYTKTLYDLDKITYDNNFEFNDWQYNFTFEYLYDTVYNINYYNYKENNELKREEYIEKYEFLLEKFNDNDWKYFVNLELDNINNEIKEIEYLNDSLNTTLDIKEHEERIKRLNLEKELLEYRLKNDISYSQNYLNDAIIEYESTTNRLFDIDKENLSYEEKRNYQSLLSDNAISKYIIDTKHNVLKENNLRTGLKDLIIDYELFIMIFVIVIASGIVSSEFKDGTAKLLLTKPYSRSKILLGKYLACLISLGIIIIYTFLCQFIVGSICFGFDSLEIPVLIYNYNANFLVEYNAIIYMLLMIVCKIPMYILMLTLAFCVSTLFNSTSLANTMAILGYLFKDFIYVLVATFNIGILKYFVTLNWDFTEYLYGKLPLVEGLTPMVSIIVCLFYYLIMIATTFVVFKRKNIKNI